MQTRYAAVVQPAEDEYDEDVDNFDDIPEVDPSSDNNNAHRLNHEYLRTNPR